MAPYLNIAEMCPGTYTLGPSRRFAIWVQGCCFSCPGCISPEWRKKRNAMLLDPQVLANDVLTFSGLEGVTISGGEPMLQADALSAFVKRIRLKSSLTVICFTGFTLQELKKKENSAIERLLSQTDVLIAGPYIEALNDNKGLRGSSNQEIHFLSGVYGDFTDRFTSGKRHIEIHLRQNYAVMVGVHPRNFSLRAFTQSMGR
jgi:anaerobic ribonucleoside-triphosphate reductase activating protein